MFTIKDKKTGKSVTFTKKPWTPKMDIRGKVGTLKIAMMPLDKAVVLTKKMYG